MVETENTISKIQIPQAAAPAAATPAAASPSAAPVTEAGGRGGPELRVHEVVAGDTLSAIAKRYYGNASQYPRIFEANRDRLSDPDKIRVGQKLTIPD